MYVRGVVFLDGHGVRAVRACLGKNNQRNVQARTIIMNDIIPTVHPGPSSSLTLLGVKLYSSSWPVIGE